MDQDCDNFYNFRTEAQEFIDNKYLKSIDIKTDNVFKA